MTLRKGLGARQQLRPDSDEAAAHVEQADLVDDPGASQGNGTTREATTPELANAASCLEWPLADQ
jgi:hypothetical protein